MACLGSIGGVDAHGDASRSDYPQVGDEPLCGIEPDYVDAAVRLEAQRQEALAEPVAAGKSRKGQMDAQTVWIVQLFLWRAVESGGGGGKK